MLPLGRLLATLLALAFANTWANADTVDLWIASPEARGDQPAGVYHATLDTERGQLTRAVLAARVDGSNFLAIHPTLPVIYTTASLEKAPSVAALRIESTGDETTLKMIGSTPTGTGGACHVQPDPTGQCLMAAHYGAGDTTIYPLAADGAILLRFMAYKHPGPASGVIASRQEAPHPHAVEVSPDGRYAFAPDLGADTIVTFALEASDSVLKPIKPVPTAPGAGPRHMVFHPDGKHAYVLNELGISVTAYDYDAAVGELSPIQTVRTLTEETVAKEPLVKCSEIRIHPTGKFLYAANRGHDSITVFRVDEASGKISLVEVESVRGGWPRNFCLDPSGRWLLAACIDTDAVTLFKIDQETGELTFTRVSTTVPAPHCVRTSLR